MVQDSSPSSPVDVAFEELFEGKLVACIEQLSGELENYATLRA